jgi:hypothetical protein
MIPLQALLSHALVAFVIEFDNEFERRMPHRTTRGGGSPGDPWLVSMAMWSNFMRLVPEEGIAARELDKFLVTRMAGWGYVTVERGVVRPSVAGRRAQEIWRPLGGEIEGRWEVRFGRVEIARLRERLAAMRFDLPEYLPVLGYGLWTRVGKGGGGGHLAALLSRVLMAFALEFERESAVSLAIYANVLRVVDGARLRDLPGVAGVSKEAVKTAVGFLEKRGLLAMGRLTAEGQRVREWCGELVRAIEERWRGRYATRELRESLEGLGDLFLGLDAHPGGWRVGRPRVLPDYPMVLHRGGFPDGS